MAHLESHVTAPPLPPLGLVSFLFFLRSSGLLEQWRERFGLGKLMLEISKDLGRRQTGWFTNG
jgi:hypothetical protein